MSRSPKSVLVTALSLLLTLAVAGTALAGSFSGTLSPGGRVCLSPIYATSYVDAQGTASPGARFLVLWAPTPYSSYATIYQSSDNTQGFHATFSRTFYGSYFPGYFKLCARNTGTVSSRITMDLYGY